MRQIENFLGQNLAVGGDDDQIGLEIFQLRDRGRAADFFRLKNFEVQLEGRFLDRAGGELELPADGPVGLRHHREHVMLGRLSSGLEARAGRSRRFR